MKTSAYFLTSVLLVCVTLSYLRASAETTLKVVDMNMTPIGSCSGQTCVCHRYGVQWLIAGTNNVWGADSYATEAELVAGIQHSQQLFNNEPNYRSYRAPLCMIETSAWSVHTVAEAVNFVTETNERLSILAGAIEDIARNEPVNSAEFVNSNVMPRPFNDYLTMIKDAAKRIALLRTELNNSSEELTDNINQQLVRLSAELDSVQHGVASYRKHRNAVIPARETPTPRPTPSRN
jgi:hypothetical protein